MAGVVLLAALIPLVRYPSLSGGGVVPFLCSFSAAGLAYVLALKRLEKENPPLAMILVFAVLFRGVLLLTPVTLSADVYRYLWDGHLLKQGINPYAEPVNSPRLDVYATPLRNRVNFPWMATPYLPAAQGYFAIVEAIAPQSPFAFQLGAVILDLAAGGLVILALRRLEIPEKASLVYLWNPLIVVEFAHGAHVDALMVFFMAAGVWGLVQGRRSGLALSALAWAAAALVKGWPLLAAPLFARRWGVKRVLIFTAGTALPLALFAAGAGWGLSGPADGRGVFGAVRIYTAAWEFNSGLYFWIAKILTPAGARFFSLAAPALAGLILGWRVWWGLAREKDDPVRWNRILVRWVVLPLGLYLALAPAVYPWYLAQILVLMPFTWPAAGEQNSARRMIWPWVYFMFFEAFTYLADSGVTGPAGLKLIQTAFYIPFWILFIHAVWQKEYRRLNFGWIYQ